MKNYSVPFTIPDTAAWAFSRAPTSDASAPETTESGPQLHAPAMKRKKKLKDMPQVLVIWNKHKDAALPTNETNTPKYVRPLMILEIKCKKSLKVKKSKP